MGPYIPMTEEDKRQMLKRIGVSSFEELIVDIPPEARFKGRLRLPEAVSEYEVKKILEDIAEQNLRLTIFAGGGSYDHYVPAPVLHIMARPEFYTAYTPYQAEVSQGTLQAMYEYQSLICELTGMDVANASMYDGGSALAEAGLMALRIRPKRNVILYPANLNPLYKRVIDSYFHGQRLQLQEVKFDKETGQLDLDDLKTKLNEDVAGVIVQHPNFFGVLEDVFEIERIVHEVGAALIVSFDPISLGILAPPGEYNADIAVAEGQPLGLPLAFGGPYLGIFTAKFEYIRQMPGRISGKTIDAVGNTGFVMTLQTREQHIKRERATSNICSNQQLCALGVAVYLSLMGKEGIKEVAEQSLFRAHYLAEKLQAIGFPLVFKGPFFREFAVRTPKPANEIVDNLIDEGFLAGVPLSLFGMDDDLLLIAVTEKRTKQEMDSFVSKLKELL